MLLVNNLTNVLYTYTITKYYCVCVYRFIFHLIYNKKSKGKNKQDFKKSDEGNIYGNKKIFSIYCNIFFAIIVIHIKSEWTLNITQPQNIWSIKIITISLRRWFLLRWEKKKNKSIYHENCIFFFFFPLFLFFWFYFCVSPKHTIQVTKYRCFVRPIKWKWRKFMDFAS